MQRGSDAAATVDVEGDLDVTTAGSLYELLRHLAAQARPTTVRVDFSRVGTIGSAGLAALTLARRELESRGKRLELCSLSDTHRAAFTLQPTGRELEPGTQARAPLLERTGLRARAGWQRFAELAELAVDAGHSGGRCIARRDRMPWSSIREQAVLVGVDALPIVAMLSFLLGLVLGFQTAFQLNKFGAEEYMADVVALGMVREFGPLITAIILAGRSGAAMAAELGTMKVSEETAALESMGISPVRFLVVPRLAAITVMQPALSLLSMLIGVGGGVAIASSLDLSASAVWQRMLWSVKADDLALGLIKSVLFAWVIGLAGCFMGLTTRGGARSVGTAATRAVVASIFFIIVIDSIVTTTWTLGRYG